MSPTNLTHYHRMKEQFDKLFFEFADAIFAPNDYNFEMVENI